MEKIAVLIPCYNEELTIEKVIKDFCFAAKNYIGNPNSLHKLGVESKRLMDAATDKVSKILKVKEYFI